MSSSKIVGASMPLQIVIPECSYCKRSIMKNLVKCNSCTKVYHPSCANRTKKCCGEDFQNSGDLDTGDISPTISEKNITKDSTHQDLLLKIIFELESKNMILLENNSLLKYKISTLETEINNKNMEIVNLNKRKNVNIELVKKFDDIPVHNYALAVKGKPVTGAVTDDPPHSTGVPNIIVTAGTSTAPAHMTAINKRNKQNNHNRIKTKNVLSKSAVNIEKIAQTEDNNKAEWNVVSHKRSTRKRSKTLVVGTNSSSSNVEGVEKFKAFHLSNLKPGTTVENLELFLKKNFSIVKCEELKSRYPESYSSFKVLVPSSEYDKALVGSNWPNNANVHRFFQQKKVNRPAD